MPIIKLTERSPIEREGKYGWESDTVLEPIYVASEHIESFAWHGATALKMASGDKLIVTESPEEILTMCGGYFNVNG